MGRMQNLVRSNLYHLVRMPHLLNAIHTDLVFESLDRLKADPRHSLPKSLIPFGHKVYSQNEEDGMIREIFKRIGTTTRTFVEFGCGDGLQNNTLALLFDGWKGLWIEASPKLAKKICIHLPKTIRAGVLTVLNAFVTRDNINQLISSAIHQSEIDLLSIDIDGNDFHVFDAIRCVEPRAVVIEYNAKFVPPTLFCMDYDEGHIWEGDDCFGASLKFLEVGFAKRGYCLVGCDLTGTNAFFIRKDLVGNKFLRPFSAETHYEPTRHHLTSFRSGHLSSFGALEESLPRRDV